MVLQVLQPFADCREDENVLGMLSQDWKKSHRNGSFRLFKGKDDILVALYWKEFSRIDVCCCQIAARSREDTRWEPSDGGW